MKVYKFTIILLFRWPNLFGFMAVSAASASKRRRPGRTCCKSFLFSIETAGKMDVITDSWTSSIFSLHLLSSMYILCCLTYSGIPEYPYSVSLSLLYPPDHWPCSFHWLWFQMKPATAKHILSCSHVVQVFFSSAKACFQSFSLLRRFQKNLGHVPPPTPHPPLSIFCADGFRSESETPANSLAALANFFAAEATPGMMSWESLDRNEKICVPTFTWINSESYTLAEIDSMFFYFLDLLQTLHRHR